MLSDLVKIAGTHVLPLFRPDVARLENVSVRRIRAQGETESQWISEPPEGLTIAAPNVLVTRSETQRFEWQYELDGVSASCGMNEAGRTGRGRAAGPAPPGYDWDTFFVPIMRRIYDHGIPSTQGELVREMLDCFLARHEEQAPDESTVRRKVALVWRELKR